MNKHTNIKQIKEIKLNGRKILKLFTLFYYFRIIYNNNNIYLI